MTVDTQSETPVRAASAAGARDPRRRTGALALLVSAQFVVMLDTSIVNVALPSIQADLALGPSALAWVVNAYVLTFGGLLLLFGRVADLIGRRRMFALGSALFTHGTLLAAFASSEWLLVAGRVVQGAGAAALSPAAMSLLLLTFPGDQRARAMSLWGTASTVGGATGVLAGGVLAGTFGWSSVFLVTVPATVAAAVLASRWLDDTPRRAHHRFDTAGAVTITAAVVALVHSALGVAGHGLSTGVLLGFAAAAALTGAFVAVERRSTDPLVPLELFCSRVMSTGVALAVLGGAARASSFVLVALYLQQALAMSPERAGLAMVPTSLAGFVVSLTLLPRALRRKGPARSLVFGLVVLAAGHFWIAHAPAASQGYAVAVLPGLLLVATGVALSFTPTTMVIASAAPASHAGLASGLASSATQVGAALGTATFTAIAFTDPDGFSAAFTAAAFVALTTALLGSTIARGPQP